MTVQALRKDNTVAVNGDRFLDVLNRVWTFWGISDLPQNNSPNGGKFPGRVIVYDPDGNINYLYPFEIGLHIEVH